MLQLNSIHAFAGINAETPLTEIPDKSFIKVSKLNLTDAANFAEDSKISGYAATFSKGYQYHAGLSAFGETFCEVFFGADSVVDIINKKFELENDTLILSPGFVYKGAIAVHFVTAKNEVKGAFYCHAGLRTSVIKVKNLIYQFGGKLSL